MEQFNRSEEQRRMYVETFYESPKRRYHIADPKKGEIYDLDFGYFLFENLPSVVAAEINPEKKHNLTEHITSLYSQGYFKKDIIDYYKHRLRKSGKGTPYETIHEYRNRVGIDDSEWENYFEIIEKNLK